MTALVHECAKTVSKNCNGKQRLRQLNGDFCHFSDKFSICRIFFPVFYDNDAKQTDWILHEKRKNNVKRHECEQFIVQLTGNGEQKTKNKPKST